MTRPAFEQKNKFCAASIMADNITKSVVVVYYSDRCQNSRRFMESLNRTRLKTVARLVNIDHTTVNGLKFLPTVVVDGTPKIGTAAFEWLKTFDGDMELQTYGGGSCKLGFSRLDDSNCQIEFVDHHDTFVAPT